MITLLLLAGCGAGNLPDPGTLRVCGYSQTLDDSDPGDGLTFGYSATVQPGPAEEYDVDPACSGGGELHTKITHSSAIAWSFYWRTEGVDFEPTFQLGADDPIYFVYKSGAVKGEDGDEEAYRPGASLVLRESTTGPLLGVLHDMPLNQNEDYPDLEVRPGEVIDGNLERSDYAIVFDADDFIAVSPGEWALATVSGQERSVGAVSARGDDAGPFTMAWAIWQP